MAEGESWQQALGRAYQWGPANQVTVSAAPIRPGGPTIATAPLGPMRRPRPRRHAARARKRPARVAPRSRPARSAR